MIEKDGVIHVITPEELAYDQTQADGEHLDGGTIRFDTYYNRKEGELSSLDTAMVLLVDSNRVPDKTAEVQRQMERAIQTVQSELEQELNKLDASATVEDRLQAANTWLSQKVRCVSDGASDENDPQKYRGIEHVVAVQLLIQTKHQLPEGPSAAKLKGLNKGANALCEPKGRPQVASNSSYSPLHVWGVMPESKTFNVALNAMQTAIFQQIFSKSSMTAKTKDQIKADVLKEPLIHLKMQKVKLLKIFKEPFMIPLH